MCFQNSENFDRQNYAPLILIQFNIVDFPVPPWCIRLTSVCLGSDPLRWAMPWALCCSSLRVFRLLLTWSYNGSPKEGLGSGNCNSSWSFAILPITGGAISPLLSVVQVFVTADTSFARCGIWLVSVWSTLVQHSHHGVVTGSLENAPASYVIFMVVSTNNMSLVENLPWSMGDSHVWE